MCCSSCQESVKRSSGKNKDQQPPKYAFANGLLIGYLPDEAWKTSTNSLFCEILTQVIAPSRPYYFVYSLLGGKCKKICIFEAF